MSGAVRQILECSLSDCQRYRYLLRVEVLPKPLLSRSLTIILKNPSTADANRGDPTTGKVEAWARHHGFGIVTYLNLFALRSPYPKTINTVDYAEAVGGENDQVIQAQLANTDTVVIAWGNPNGIEPARYQRRVLALFELLRASQQIIYLVGDRTRFGYPRHGLQWRKEMGIARLGN